MRYMYKFLFIIFIFILLSSQIYGQSASVQPYQLPVMMDTGLFPYCQNNINNVTFYKTKSNLDTIFELGVVGDFAFSKDGRYLVLATSTGFEVFDSSGYGYRMIKKVVCNRYYVKAVISPDSGYVYLGGLQGSVDKWDIMGNNMETLFTQPSEVTALAISKNGNLIACGYKNGLSLLYNNEKRQSSTYNFHNNKITGLDFSFNNSYLFSCGIDGNIWSLNVATSDKNKIYSCDEWLLDIKCRPGIDKTQFAVATSHNKILLFDTDLMREPNVSNETMGLHQGWVTSIDFSSDGKYLFGGSNDTTFSMWDLSSNFAKIIYRYKHTVSRIKLKPSTSSNDNVTLIIQYTNNAIKSTNISTSSRQVTSESFFPKHSSIMVKADVSRYGRFIGAAFEDNTISTWNLSKKPFINEKYEMFNGRINSISVVENGKIAFLAAGSDDKTVKVIVLSTTHGDVSSSLEDEKESDDDESSEETSSKPVKSANSNLPTATANNIQPGEENDEDDDESSSESLVKYNAGEVISINEHQGPVTQVAAYTDVKNKYHTLASASNNRIVITNLDYLKDPNLIQKTNNKTEDDDSPGQALKPKSTDSEEDSDGEAVSSFTKANEIVIVSGFVTALSFNDDGQYILVGTDDGKIFSIDTDHKFKLTEIGSISGKVTTIVSGVGMPDVFYTGGTDKTVRKWSIKDKKQLLSVTNLPDIVSSISAADDDETMLIGCVNGQVKKYDSKSQRLDDFENINSPIRNISLIPAEKKLDWIYLSSSDGTIRLIKEAISKGPAVKSEDEDEDEKE